MLIKTDAYTLEISDKTGNIVSFRGITGYDYIEKETPLVRLSLLKSNGERVIAESGDCSAVERKGNTVTVRYEEIGGLPVSAVASFRVEQPSLVGMRLSLSNRTDMRTESALYPGIIIKNRLSVDG